MTLQVPDADDLWLVYDGECPVCSNYCRHIRLRETVGPLHLVDARQPSPLMDEITHAGLDIDQGMVLKVRGQLYYGDVAMHMITLMSTRAGWFNRLSLLLFGTPLAARIFYPAGKAVRNLLLKVLGIAYIDNLNGKRPVEP
jgi:predicted DCC family thiol-disulfide oxidoreductase YuxK